MGEVDKSDQIKKAYEIDHRYKFKYYTQLFDNMLDTMVVNSYLVCLKLSRKYNRSPMTHDDFREEVVSDLFGIFFTRRHSVSQPSAKRPRVQMPNRVPLHLPIQHITRKRCQTVVQKELKIVAICTAALVVAIYVL